MISGQGYVPGRYTIDDYLSGGFRFADMSHRGSILVTPAGVRAIDAKTAADIDAALIDLALATPLDLLIIGTGKDMLPFSATLRAKLRNAGVGCEAMATGAAVRTYNVLVGEDRRAGALLIAVE